MIALTKAVVKQMSAHKLTNKVAINGMGLGIGLHRFHSTQVSYLFITNAGLLLLTSLVREKPFTKICPPSLCATNLVIREKPFTRTCHPGSGGTNLARTMYTM